MVPKLRFNQFHSSWCAKKLGEVGEIISGLTYSPENIRKSGLLVLRSSNIQSGKLCFEDCVYVDLIVDDEKKTRKNDILICVRNGSRSLIGKNTLIKEVNQETTHGAFMTVFRGPLNSYVAQLLQTKKFYSQVYSDLGATINSINGGNLKRYSFSFPSDFNETAKISDFLSYVDEKITLLNKQYNLLCQYKKGMMQKIFSQELRFKDDNGGNFPEWIKNPLGDVVTFFNGRAYKQTEWEHNGVPVIRLQNLTGSGSEYYYSNLELPDHQYCNYGDLLYMWSATMGPVWWKGSKAIFHYHIWKVISVPGKSTEDFIYYILDNITQKMLNEANGTTMAHITKAGIEKKIVNLPSIKEQIKIAKFLSAIDDKVSLKKAELDKLKTWKQGLLQQMLV